jgi:hypothetical protein
MSFLKKCHPFLSPSFTPLNPANLIRQYFRQTDLRFHRPAGDVGRKQHPRALHQPLQQITTFTRVEGLEAGLLILMHVEGGT